MAKWYESLEYGVFDGKLINRAEFYTLRKAGVVFEVVGE